MAQEFASVNVSTGACAFGEIKGHGEIADFNRLRSGIGQRNRPVQELAIELEGLRATMRADPDRANALLAHSLQAVREGLSETRRALQELRAKPLEDLGLALAVAFTP